MKKNKEPDGRAKDDKAERKMEKRTEGERGGAQI